MFERVNFELSHSFGWGFFCVCVLGVLFIYYFYLNKPVLKQQMNGKKINQKIQHYFNIYHDVPYSNKSIFNQACKGRWQTIPENK